MEKVTNPVHSLNQRGDSIMSVMLASMVLSIAMTTALQVFSNKDKVLEGMKASESVEGVAVLIDSFVQNYYKTVLHWFTFNPIGCKWAGKLMKGQDCRTVVQPYDNSLQTAIMSHFSLTIGITVPSGGTAGVTPPPVTRSQVIWPFASFTPASGTPPPALTHMTFRESKNVGDAMDTDLKNCLLATSGTKNLNHVSTAASAFSDSSFYQCFFLDMNATDRIFSDAGAAYRLNRVPYSISSGTPIPAKTPNVDPDGNNLGEFTFFIARVQLVNSAVPTAIPTLASCSPALIQAVSGRALKVNVTYYHVRNVRNGRRGESMVRRQFDTLVNYNTKPAVNCNNWSPDLISDPLHYFACGPTPFPTSVASMSDLTLTGNPMAGCN